MGLSSKEVISWIDLEVNSNDFFEQELEDAGSWLLDFSDILRDRNFTTVTDFLDFFRSEVLEAIKESPAKREYILIIQQLRKRVKLNLIRSFGGDEVRAVMLKFFGDRKKENQWPRPYKIEMSKFEGGARAYSWCLKHFGSVNAAAAFLFKDRPEVACFFSGENWHRFNIDAFFTAFLKVHSGEDWNESMFREFSHNLWGRDVKGKALVEDWRKKGVTFKEGLKRVEVSVALQPVLSRHKNSHVSWDNKSVSTFFKSFERTIKPEETWCRDDFKNHRCVVGGREFIGKSILEYWNINLISFEDGLARAMPGKDPLQRYERGKGRYEAYHSFWSTDKVTCFLTAFFKQFDLSNWKVEDLQKFKFSFGDVSRTGKSLIAHFKRQGATCTRTAVLNHFS